MGFMAGSGSCLGFGAGLVASDGAIAGLGERDQGLPEDEARLLRLPARQVAHGRLPAVAGHRDLRLAQAALLDVCDD